MKRCIEYAVRFHESGADLDDIRKHEDRNGSICCSKAPRRINVCMYVENVVKRANTKNERQVTGQVVTISEQYKTKMWMVHELWT